MNWRSKWVFWGVVIAVLTISAVPSIILLQAVQRYYQFLTGFEPDTLRPARISRIPRHERPSADARSPLLDFVEFRVAAPKAKHVAILGDFTQWKERGLAMSRQEGGLWELLLPLPPGHYHYAYMIDGTITLDPKAPMEPSGSRNASLKIVR